MSAFGIQSLIGTAVTDSNFRMGLLNGSRLRLLKNFSLTEHEIETIMSIRANSLEQLAGEIHRRLMGDEELQPLPAYRARKAPRVETNTIWISETIDSSEPTPAWSV